MRTTRTTILLFTLTVGTVCADDKISAPDFSRYQQTMHFQEIIQVQTNAAWQLGQRTNILAITVFDHGSDRVVTEYFISQNGKGISWRNVPAWAHQPGKKIKQSLSDSEMKKLQSAIEELPAKNDAPPLERLLIVSFQSGTNWITRAYDRQALPRPMLDICEVADLGIETKNQK
ncbi:MAG: hypothetical protein HY298_23300 [Verrucomicrobia bacterium]|nr:hypothetical protein [Verrucomicrobiota bacterium]